MCHTAWDIIFWCVFEYTIYLHTCTLFSGEDWIKIPLVNPTFWLNHIFFTTPYQWRNNTVSRSNHIIMELPSKLNMLHGIEHTYSQDLVSTTSLSGGCFVLSSGPPLSSSSLGRSRQPPLPGRIFRRCYSCKDSIHDDDDLACSLVQYIAACTIL